MLADDLISRIAFDALEAALMVSEKMATATETVLILASADRTADHAPDAAECPRQCEAPLSKAEEDMVVAEYAGGFHRY
jgi:hypothetical protein